MINAIISNVVLPASTRLGSMATGLLVGWGASQQHADWVGTGIAGALLIGTDFMLAWFRKRAIQKKAGTAEDFAAFLTTRTKILTAGASEPVYDAIDAVQEYQRAARK